jgi:hypothetical protein
MLRTFHGIAQAAFSGPQPAWIFDRGTTKLFILISLRIDLGFTRS